MGVDVAALFVVDGGPYFGLPNVDPWPERMDARRYPGPLPVVAHPPCAAWGAYAKPTTNSIARGPLRGDDGGCFEAALLHVRRWGGVIEHPRKSSAFQRYGLIAPPCRGWCRALLPPHQAGPEWVCVVDQGHYGHPAPKPTWLYYVGHKPPEPMIWGPSAADGRVEHQSKRQRKLTPPAFRDALILMAGGSAG
jgi:hypothetical protein